MGEVNGRSLVFFAGGDGVCYAFEPLRAAITSDQLPALHKVWSFDCDPTAPKENVQKYRGNLEEGPVNIFGMPVFHENRVYVAAGGDYWHGRRISYLKCIDAAGQGDITKSGEVWSYAMDQHCMATPAIQGDLVFIADCRGGVHCLDIKTGKAHWVAQTGGEIWDSMLVADGKVYAANRSGKVSVFAADKEQKLIASFKLDGPIHGSPTAANGVVYIATMKRLYAIGKPR
jgi:outer membrane protein assembly factor BamB